MTSSTQPNPMLKFALELGPLAVFFVANARADLPTATAALMVATAVALVVSYVWTRQIPVMPVVSGIVVLVFGSLTLVLQDELFIKLKPTIVNSLFAAVLLGGLALGKPLLGYVFGAVFQLTEEGWRRLTLRWGLFFIFLAVLNEVVWRSFSTDVWVSFKVFGIMPLTMLFAVAQLPLLTRHALPEGTGGDARP